MKRVGRHWDRSKCFFPLIPHFWKEWGKKGFFPPIIWSVCYCQPWELEHRASAVLVPGLLFPAPSRACACLNMQQQPTGKHQNLCNGVTNKNIARIIKACRIYTVQLMFHAGFGGVTIPHSNMPQSTAAARRERPPRGASGNDSFIGGKFSLSSRGHGEHLYGTLGL